MRIVCEKCGGNVQIWRNRRRYAVEIRCIRCGMISGMVCRTDYSETLIRMIKARQATHFKLVKNRNNYEFGRMQCGTRSL